jgi:hypothetical protein
MLPLQAYEQNAIINIWAYTNKGQLRGTAIYTVNTIARVNKQ